MKKTLLFLFCMLFCSIAANAQSSAKKVNRYTDMQLSYVPTSSYEEQGNDVANYYFVATSTESRFDSSTGELQLPNGGYALMVDFYAPTSDPIQLAPGTYTPSPTHEAGTYDPSFTVFQYMASNGKVTDYEVKGNIIVSLNESSGLYTVKLEEPIYSSSQGMFTYYYNVSYVGDMGFRSTHTTDQFYPAIARNVNETFTGALAIYRGDEMDSSTGSMWTYVYTAAYDENTGALVEPGFMVRMFLFNRLFGDPSQAELVPGTYTVARNFKKNTFFPGMEINYMGATIPYGSMAYETDGNELNDKVAYITDGTYTVEHDGTTGDYTLTLDLRTSLGYRIQGTYTGPIKVIDEHVEKTKVVISTLEEDLDMNLSRIKAVDVRKNTYTEEAYAGTSWVSPSTTYISDIAQSMGLTHYVLDLGYGADAEITGTDEEGNPTFGTDGGDLMRIEFFADENEPIFPSGVYTVMDTAPSIGSNYYAAGKALQGYFLPGGELSGTRWAHNAANPYADRYWHWDGHAPAVDGKITIQRNADDTFTIDVDVIDDGGFNITGSWTGPARFHWDVESEGIGTVLAPEQNGGRGFVYDLQGRRHSTLREGINIIGGKKVLK